MDEGNVVYEPRYNKSRQCLMPAVDICFCYIIIRNVTFTNK